MCKKQTWLYPNTLQEALTQTVSRIKATRYTP